MTDWTCADLYDANEKARSGGRGVANSARGKRFAGPIRTIKVFEDNPLVKAALAEPGEGGCSSWTAAPRCGPRSSSRRLGADNGLGGDRGLRLRTRPRGDRQDRRIRVRCLGTTPRRSTKHGFGERGVLLRFAGVSFEPGAWLYADEDGILVAPGPLTGA
ncbi:MAG: hypothetical protein R3B82_09895 [Sandaracinaceae bacterium]